jgi:uncharacterized membrane protein YfcA
VVNLLAGSLVGAWAGAAWATRMRTATLHRVLAVLLVVMAATLIAFHGGGAPEAAPLPAVPRAVAALAAGFGIGVVAAVMGVAGGELLIPTITVLYAVDITVAGSLSLAVSLPTMLVSIARYRLDPAFVVLRDQAPFVAAMTAGSVTGAVAGGLLLGVAPSAVLVPGLVGVLLLSAVRVWRH